MDKPKRTPIHRNIAVIYGVEDRALVMESVEGENTCLGSRIPFVGSFPFSHRAELETGRYFSNHPTIRRAASI